jgi:GNAT superfamily N-acetyltransferase
LYGTDHAFGRLVQLTARGDNRCVKTQGLSDTGLEDTVIWLNRGDSPTTALTDADLYLRGAETLLASWEEYARGATGASVRRSPGVAAAVFPNEPERAVYSNALLERYLAAADRADAIDAMEAAYAAAGVTSFAAWVHESDEAMRGDLERRGYALEESTRAMGMTLDDIRLPRPEIDLGPPDWFECLRIIGVPPGLLGGADHAAFHVLVARLGGENVATAMAFDLRGDCGIYNVATLEGARRRGLGTALTAVQAHDALARGCQTASLQSSKMAERVYAAIGFRDLGRILEYVPQVRLRCGPLDPELRAAHAGPA